MLNTCRQRSKSVGRLFFFWSGANSKDKLAYIRATERINRAAANVISTELG
ncbi:unnamed protein product [Schistosoma mattheei]|uniref:Uncharacterized protein n=1 Tax=Schistosoma mattheei TaxID=31246 RepID=A0A3P7ZUR4_9TREM|nr:unnamed protein product [Schistosoma mattheei]